MRPVRPIATALALLLLLSPTALAVVRGTADPGDPAVVQVGSCSGVVVSPHVVLTSASCFAFSVVFGPSELEATHVIDIVGRDSHPHYDIGMVTLAEVAPVTPIEMNREHLLPYVGQTARLVGYGATDESAFGDGIKREGPAYVSHLQGVEMWLEYNAAAPCVGDEGGPLLMTFDDGVERVAGVVSRWIRVFECGTSDFAAVRTDSVVDWLDEYIIAAEPSDPPAIVITAPVDGDSVLPSFPVVVDATDDHGVSRVELWVDGVINDLDEAEPFDLHGLPTLALGGHQVEARAYDAAGQETVAAISITIGAACSGAGPAGCGEGDTCVDGICRHQLGGSCEMHGECESGLCGIVDGFGACTQRCGRAGDPSCPSGFLCEPPMFAGGSSQCVPGAPLDGCSSSPGRPGWGGVILIAWAAVVYFSRRRSPRR